MDTTPKDPRSTGRKRARKTLERIGRPYFCGSNDEGDLVSRVIRLPSGRQATVGCGRSPSLQDAPGGYYPSMAPLECNHINKKILDNDPVNLEWLCKSCHKDADSATVKGVSIVGDEYGYSGHGPPVGDDGYGY